MHSIIVQSRGPSEHTRRPQLPCQRARLSHAAGCHAPRSVMSEDRRWPMHAHSCEQHALVPPPPWHARGSHSGTVLPRGFTWPIHMLHILVLEVSRMWALALIQQRCCQAGGTTCGEAT